MPRAALGPQPSGNGQYASSPILLYGKLGSRQTRGAQTKKTSAMAHTTKKSLYVEHGTDLVLAVYLCMAHGSSSRTYFHVNVKNNT